MGLEPHPVGTRLVYRPKTPAEAARRVERGKALVGIWCRGSGSALQSEGRLMYSPQIQPAATPDGWIDEEFEYYFDSTTNTPALGVQLSPGQTKFNIPLQLQADAIFIVRAVIVNNPQQNLGVRFRDAFGRYLSDDIVPSFAYSSFAKVTGSGNQQALPGVAPVVVEPELFCPAGSQLLVDLANIG